MEEIMKFKPGNLLYHEKSNGLWLVVEVIPINKKGSRPLNVLMSRPTIFRLQMNATCVQPGKSKVNYSGSTDTWFMKQEDGSDHDDAWTVISEV
jgi:hypothetical protein